MTTSTVQRAEALLRSLVGITAAEVRMSPGGRLEVVRVATARALSNGQVVQNVRSALFAGLGYRIDPGQIELVDDSSWVATPVAAGAAAAEVAEAERVELIEPLVETNGNGKNGRSHGANGNGNGHGAAPAAAIVPPVREAVIAQRLGGNGNGQAPVPANGNGAAHAHAPSANGGVKVAVAPAHAPASAHSLQVERVELLRQGGRIRCRVALAAGAERFAAVADAAEDTVPEFQLAARVTCDTVRAAQLTSAHFDGATLAHVAGRTHVVVALSEWKAGNQLVSHTGSAVVTDRLEHAAALAVLQALRGI